MGNRYWVIKAPREEVYFSFNSNDSLDGCGYRWRWVDDRKNCHKFLTRREAFAMRDAISYGDTWAIASRRVFRCIG